MKLLVVAATEAEIMPFTSRPPEVVDMKDVDILITGVGMVATTYALTKKLLTSKYDLVIQAGVGGSFDKNITLGSVVFVASERFADLGAEDRENYLDVFDMGLIQANEPPFSNRALQNPMGGFTKNIGLQVVAGLTVNTVSGSEQTISRRMQYGCTVESMEGATFHYVCLRENVRFAQIRSISNYVTPRDKSQWKMKEAIINLNDWLIDFTGDH